MKNIPFLPRKLLTSKAASLLRRKERLFLNQEIITRNIYFLLSRNMLHEAIDLYDLAKYANHQKIFHGPPKKNYLFRGHYLISFHGFRVGYDATTHDISASDLILPRSGIMPIIARKIGDKILLTINIENNFLYLSCRDGKIELTDNPFSEKNIYIQPSSNKNGLFYVSVTDCGYLLTNPHRCEINSPNDDTWEQLTLLPSRE